MQRLKALTPSNRNGYKVSRKRYHPNGTVGKVAHGIATAKSVAGNGAMVGDTDGDTRCSRYRLNVDSGNDGDGDIPVTETNCVCSFITSGVNSSRF